MMFGLLRPFVFDRPEGPGREFLALCGPARRFHQRSSQGLGPAAARCIRPTGRSAFGAKPLAELLEWKKIFGNDEVRHAGRRVHGGAERHGGRIVVVAATTAIASVSGRGGNIHEFENPAAIGDVRD